MIPMPAELDFYYRHARKENLLMMGPEINRYKNPWVREQMQLFQKLGWKFAVIDCSGEMGSAQLLGEKWSVAERRALQNIQNPLIRVFTVRDLLETMDQVIVTMEQWELPLNVCIHLGDVVWETEEQQSAFITRLRKLLSFRTGLWVVAPSMKTIPLDLAIVHFHTHVVIPGMYRDVEIYDHWIQQLRMGIEETDLNLEDIGEKEAIFAFRGRSEGARGKIFRSALDTAL